MNAERHDTVTHTRTAAGPADPAATPLGRLVHPLATDEFLGEHFMVRPVHLTGWPRRLDGLFDLAGLRAAVLRQHETGLSVRVSADHVGDDGGAGRHVPIDAANIAEHLRRGASVCVDPLERAVPALHRLAGDLRREIGHAGPVSVKCYLSPRGFGFNTHFDAHVVTTLQLQGSKRWRFSRRPAVENPVDNAFLDARGGLHYMHRPPSSLRAWERADPADAEFDEVVLRPGDVLCLPPGTWHEAKAESTSLALNVAFEYVDLLGLVVEAARDRLIDEPDWRAVPPGAGVAPADRLARLAAVITAPSFADDVARAWRRAADEGPPAQFPSVPADASVPDGATPWTTATAGTRIQCLVPVRDIAHAVEWYGRALGYRPIHTVPAFGWAELDTGRPGVTVGLTEDTHPYDATPRLGIEVTDLDEVAASLRRVGVAVADAGSVAGIARFARAHDGDGNALLFFQPDRPGQAVHP